MRAFVKGEWPLPPSYAANFASAPLPVPAIEPDSDLSTEYKSKCLAFPVSLSLSTENAEYMESVKGSFNSVFHALIEFAATEYENDAQRDNMNAHLNNLYSLLDSYRKHQAREDICTVLNSRIRELEVLEKEMCR